MVEEENKISGGIAISVERMFCFCHLTQMIMEYIPRETLPLHLTRAGTLMTITCSFLYSLFDKRNDSTNLLRIWTGFDHPFHQELSSIAKKLTPYEDNLYTAMMTCLNFISSMRRQLMPSNDQYQAQLLS